MRGHEVCLFLVGFTISVTTVLSYFYFNFLRREKSARLFKTEAVLLSGLQISSEVYNKNLSKLLFDESKILCIVLTQPKNHKTKAKHVQNTWSRRCNKLLFVSSEPDDELEVVLFPGVESREGLWNKTLIGFQFAYDNYIDDFDWFLKADDDSYLIIENLRSFLSQYNPKTSLYFGHRYASQWIDEGYMAGGGYILSNKALRKLKEKLIGEPTCRPNNGSEDLGMGKCLAHSAIFVDCRDELKQKRFFPNKEGIELHVAPTIDPKNFFKIFQYYNVTQGNLDCCSDRPVAFHYVKPQSMHFLEYLVYKVYPFGLDQVPDLLPRKFLLQEIIQMSDVKSSGPYFISHKMEHNFDETEFY